MTQELKHHIGIDIQRNKADNVQEIKLIKDKKMSTQWIVCQDSINILKKKQEHTKKMKKMQVGINWINTLFDIDTRVW